MRRPVSATALRVFPSLAVVAATGALAGCESPRCGETRGAELEAHGPNATDALSRGEARRAAHELSVGLGLRAHTPSPRVPSPVALGAVSRVTETPVVLVQAPNPPPAQSPTHQINAPGRMPMVRPHPPPQPQARPVHSVRHGGRPARINPGPDL